MPFQSELVFTPTWLCIFSVSLWIQGALGGRSRLSIFPISPHVFTRWLQMRCAGMSHGPHDGSCTDFLLFCSYCHSYSGPRLDCGHHRQVPPDPSSESQVHSPSCLPEKPLGCPTGPSDSTPRNSALLSPPPTLSHCSCLLAAVGALRLHPPSHRAKQAGFPLSRDASLTCMPRRLPSLVGSSPSMSFKPASPLPLVRPLSLCLEYCKSIQT